MPIIANVDASVKLGLPGDGMLAHSPLATDTLAGWPRVAKFSHW
jgi:hypothetical protein